MNEEKNETRWDRLLAVRTTGRDDTNADQYRYPYEPTPYSVLERLANSGLIRKENTRTDSKGKHIARLRLRKRKS